jgi:hypothetical protein
MLLKYKKHPPTGLTGNFYAGTIFVVAQRALP